MCAVTAKYPSTMFNVARTGPRYLVGSCIYQWESGSVVGCAAQSMLRRAVNFRSSPAQPINGRYAWIGKRALRTTFAASLANVRY